jgi:hypothetical protein
MNYVTYYCPSCLFIRKLNFVYITLHLLYILMIIVTCGFAGSGKDTIGNFLVKEYGYIKLSFAFVLHL